MHYGTEEKKSLVARYPGKVQSRPCLCYNRFSPARQRLGDHKYIFQTDQLIRNCLHGPP